jgi:hypothetical protein
MRRKVLKGLVSVFLVLCACANTWAGDLSLEAVSLYAHFDAVILSRSGNELNVNPSVKEYHEIKVWEPSETYTSPDKFDAIAIISNQSNSKRKNITVNFQICAKVAALTSVEPDGPADVEHGQRTAVWQKPEFTKAVRIKDIAPNAVIPVYLKDIDLKAIWGKYYDQGKWPYFVKVTAWLSCGKCDPSKRLETILEVIPGD